MHMGFFFQSHLSIEWDIGNLFRDSLLIASCAGNKRMYTILQWRCWCCRGTNGMPSFKARLLRLNLHWHGIADCMLVPQLRQQGLS